MTFRCISRHSANVGVVCLSRFIHLTPITAITEGIENASLWTMPVEGVKGLITVYVSVMDRTPAVDAEVSVYGMLTSVTIADAAAEVEEHGEANID